jgi:hypothetical protein
MTFDENIFPFSKLCPNSCPRLRAKISLLPSSLVPMTGDESVLNHMSNAPNPVEDYEKMQNQQVAADNEAAPCPGTAPRDDSPCADLAPDTCTSPIVDLPRTDPVPATHQVRAVSAIDGWLVPATPTPVSVSSPEDVPGASTCAPVAGPDNLGIPLGPGTASTPGIVSGSLAVHGSGGTAASEQLQNQIPAPARQFYRIFYTPTHTTARGHPQT